MRFAIPLLIAVVLVLASALWGSPRLRHEIRGWFEDRGWVGTTQESPTYLRRLEDHRRQNPSLSPDCVLLFGDSLVEGMGPSGASPAGWVNRGMSGDRVRHLRDRLAPSVLEAPCRRVALCIGINDLMHEGAEPRALADEIVGLADELASRGRRVWVHSLPPAEPPLGRLAEPIRRTNALLEDRVRARPTLSWVPLHARLADAAPAGGWTRDGIHLEAPAYRSWVELLEASLASEQGDLPR